jgi:hypothetical protein
VRSGGTERISGVFSGVEAQAGRSGAVAARRAQRGLMFMDWMMGERMAFGNGCLSLGFVDGA